jgi:hypothetical protein
MERSNLAITKVLNEIPIDPVGKSLQVHENEGAEGMFRTERVAWEEAFGKYTYGEKPLCPMEGERIVSPQRIIT